MCAFVPQVTKHLLTGDTSGFAEDEEIEDHESGGKFDTMVTDASGKEIDNAIVQMGRRGNYNV